jgi:hypothetical protein
VAGRFLKHQKRCIREEENKSNKQVIAKVLVVQMSLLAARSEWNHARIFKYITGTDRHYVRAQTELRLTHPYNTAYLVKYLVFAPIFSQGRYSSDWIINSFQAIRVFVGIFY